MTPVYAALLLCTPTALSSQVFKACLHVCSSKREPLGKGYVRGHQIPDGLGDATPFGVAIHAQVGPVQAPNKGRCISMQHYYAANKSPQIHCKATAMTATTNNKHQFTTLCLQELDRAGQAKSAMFPKDHPSGSSRDPKDPTHPLYVTSHGAYAAGEQRHRHYDWNRAGLDPATHSFGEAASHIGHRQHACFRHFTIQHAEEAATAGLLSTYYAVQQLESRQLKLHWQV